MRGGKAMHLFPGRPHSLPSCRTLSFSRIMSGDGESRTACATRGLAGDPAKSFWQGWESLRGKGRPFFKKGLLPLILLFLLFSFHIGQQLADAVQSGGRRVLETRMELIADDAFQGIGQPGEEAVGQGFGLRHRRKAA